MKTEMKQVSFLDLKMQYRAIAAELGEALKSVLETQRFVLKENVRCLEEEIARTVGARHAVGVASGSDALYLSLLALGVGPGDEVVTSPFTFFATAGAVSRTGARPVFADIEPATFNLDPKKLTTALSPRTKAVIPVHLFGLACDMAPILEAAWKRSIPVVEDAAQAFGAACQGKKAGAWGEAACLSFFPTKNLGGAGDGGMVLTSREDVAEKVRVLRVHGSRTKYHHELVGINSRLDELQAAVLRVKLKHVEGWNAARRAHAAAYDAGLAGLPVKTPVCPPGYTHVYHLYSILTPRRDELARFLSARGVETAIYYPLSLHLQPCFAGLGYKKGDFPVSEKVSAEILSLPMYPELTEEARAFVVASTREFFLSSSRKRGSDRFSVDSRLRGNDKQR